MNSVSHNKRQPGTAVPYADIVIRPRKRQIILELLPLYPYLLLNALILHSAREARIIADEELSIIILTTLSMILVTAGIVFTCKTLRRLLVRHTITGEQLMIDHGLLTSQRDYVELHRIIDFHESRTLMQQMLGLKTVTVHTCDRRNMVVRIPGVDASLDLVGLIRHRVEKSKRAKGVYEITNR